MEIKISSSRLQLNEVENFIRKLFEKFKIRDELFFKTQVCVNEAVVNSIMHGNKFEENKLVTISSFTANSYLYFSIADEGEGFDFNDLPDPTHVDNIFKETGRGIFIIKNISEEIIFKDKGNIIEFKIKLDEKN